MTSLRKVLSISIFAFFSAITAAGQTDRVGGTLVVGVPVDVGLVACADKRLFNAEAGTFTDNFVKIRRAGPNAVFAATHTIGFYDRKTKLMAFDAFKVVEGYVEKNPFRNDKDFWDGLKVGILQRMLTYLSSQPYSSWPETDSANRGLLFNLIFFSISNGKPYSQTVKVLYEKKKTPVVTVLPPIAELITAPVLAGKGREVLKYLDRNPAVATDAALERFDERSFSVSTTTTSDAVEFVRKLLTITSTVVPQAHVSPTFNCALLDRQSGYRLIEN